MKQYANNIDITFQSSSGKVDVTVIAIFQLFGMERYFILTTIIESIFDRSPWQCGIISVVSDYQNKPNP